MRRGEVWLTRFDGAFGGEIQKTRPALIVSNDHVNEILNRLQIVPTSSRIEMIYPTEVPVEFAGRKSKAMVDQITTADKRRLLRRLGELSQSDMEKIERAIRIQLSLKS